MGAPMNGKVVNLPTKSQQHKESMLEMIDQLRARVDEGDITAFAIAYVGGDGYIGTGFPECSNVGAILGAITLLQSRVIYNTEHESDPPNFRSV